MTNDIHADGFTSVGTSTPDRLYDRFEVRRKRAFKAGQGVVPRGTAVGKISVGADSVTATAGSIGDGALSFDASAPLVAGYKVGTYTVRCIAAAVNGGTFRVTDPEGAVLGDADVGTVFANHVRFVITAGAADFAVDDGFDLNVSADVGTWVRSAATVMDGSEVIRGVLLHDVDTASEAEGIVGSRGRCNPAALILGEGHTVASIDDACLDRGIIFETVIG